MAYPAGKTDRDETGMKKVAYGFVRRSTIPMNSASQEVAVIVFVCLRIPMAITALTGRRCLPKA